MNKVGQIQKDVETEVSEIKRFENEYRKVITSKQKFTEQKQENEMVLSEFKLLAEEANVYKLVGPILAKQPLSECRSNVEKRVEFIAREIARQEGLEAEFQSKITEKSNNVKRMQAEFQKIFGAVQAKAQQQQAA